MILNVNYTHSLKNSNYKIDGMHAVLIDCFIVVAVKSFLKYIKHNILLHVL